MKKLILLTLFFYAAVLPALAQQRTGGIKGTVVSRIDRGTLEGVHVTLNTAEPKSTYTDDQGQFVFTDVPNGVWEVTLEMPDYVTSKMPVKVDGMIRDLGTVTLAAQFNKTAPDVNSIPEFDTENANDEFSQTPVVLTSSNDVFDNIATSNFGQMRFRARGYETSSNDVYFNGILLNDAQSGYSPWSLWGGLNDATRNQESTSGLFTSEYGVGSINGTTAIQATASQMRKGFRVSLVNSSAQYRFRAMMTYGSGESDRGWSWALSASTRQGGNDWVKGVDYNAWAYYGSIEKRICHDHHIALTVFGSPTVRGMQAASTQEVYDLVSSNYYNPNWGYQGGKSDPLSGRYLGGGTMRNARERISHEPVAILNYTWDANRKTKLLVGASYRFGISGVTSGVGSNGSSSLDWYDGWDPRPDYYRNLPSYYKNDPAKQAYIREGWLSEWDIRQVNWNKMYNANYESFFTPDIVTNPTVNSMTRRSIYAISERRADQRDANINVELISQISKKTKINAGVAYRWNRTEYFQSMKDLLGGDYWLDIDKFAERDFAGGDTIQNDLNNPNRLIKKGDKYSYDYYGTVQNARAWATMHYNWHKIEAYAALEAGGTQFWRTGLYRKGLFPNDSYGDSDKKDFFTYTGKVGLTYKFNPQHIIYANVAYLNEAPFFYNSMVSPRTRNEFVHDLKTTKTFSGDINYALHLPWIRARLSAYCTSIKDQTNVISFYDDSRGTFSNFVMTGIDQMNTGVEFGFQSPLTRNLTLKGAVSYGYFIYTSNPRVTETADNSSAIILDNEAVYWKNYKVDGTPQTAASIGLDYRSQHNLFLSIDAGYYNANYISMNPMRRTDVAYQNLTPEQAAAMGKQERFPQAFLLNASLGKIWYIKNYMLGFNVNVNNVLNNKNIKSGGYEQMRLNKDTSSGATVYTPFDSKYFYLFGTNYYLNIYLRF